MALDVYHRILQKLLEATSGSEKVPVPLSDVVRKEGFTGAADDIYTVLSREGWIADAPRPGSIFLTHWGVAEIRKALAAASPAKTEDPAAEEARQLATAARELAEAFEALAVERSGGRDASAAERQKDALAKLKALDEAAAHLAPLAMPGKPQKPDKSERGGRPEKPGRR